MSDAIAAATMSHLQLGIMLIVLLYQARGEVRKATFKVKKAAKESS